MDTLELKNTITEISMGSREEWRWQESVKIKIEHLPTLNNREKKTRKKNEESLRGLGGINKRFNMTSESQQKKNVDWNVPSLAKDTSLQIWEAGWTQTIKTQNNSHPDTS